jgi:hypothetical protein
MELESREDGIPFPVKRREADALAAVAEIGLDADHALGRVAAPLTAEQAISSLRSTRGSVSLARPAASVLGTFAERGFSLAASPRGRFRALFGAIDLEAAHRCLNDLTGAMR